MSLTEKPVYRASAQLLLQSKQSESIFQPASVSGTPERVLLNEIEIVNSLRVRKAVEKAFGKPVTIRAEGVGENDVMMSRRRRTGRMLRAESTSTQRHTRSSDWTARPELAQSKVVSDEQVVTSRSRSSSCQHSIAALDVRILGDRSQ